MNTLTGYLRQAGTALRFLLFATLVLGLAYPLAVFGAGQLIAPYQANGSILKDSAGAPAASALIVQAAADDSGAQDPRWFHARPSAVKWDPASSSASPTWAPTIRNCSTPSPPTGPPSPRLKAWIAATVPADAVTASGSGLDPDISPEYARLQVARVAAAQRPERRRRCRPWWSSTPAAG